MFTLLNEETIENQHVIFRDLRESVSLCDHIRETAADYFPRLPRQNKFNRNNRAPVYEGARKVAQKVGRAFL